MVAPAVVPGSLAELLSPQAPAQFLDACWGKSYLHVPGWRGKFSHLLPWNELNRILRQHRLDSPRLRLVLEGKPVPDSLYVRRVYSRRRPGSPIPRLNAAALTGQLLQGATLVLDAVDELHAPVTALAQALERDFHVRIQINAYAGWRASHGFDIHWDDHDVLVLQIAGRKRWAIYGLTRAYPLARDSEPNRTPPKQALWEGILEDGGLLYIPRGWWHVAAPLDEPTLHLTLGIPNPTGVDLMNWLAERLREHAIFRQDLPRFASPAERANHAERLCRQLVESWSPDLLDRYFAHSDAAAQPRAQFSLPWSASAEPAPLGDSMLVRWLAPRPVAFQSNGAGAIEFTCQGRRWKFAAKAGVILAALNDGRSHSVRELCDLAASELDPGTVRIFLRELTGQGLVAIVDSDAKTSFLL